MSVKDFFQQQVGDYSSLFADLPRGKNLQFRTRLFAACHLTQGISGKLLDCACGSGEITAAILQQNQFAKADIVDISDAMLKQARPLIERNVNDTKVEFLCSDIFPFVAGHRQADYHLILCLGLIAHTGRVEHLLSGLREMLAPDGKILLQTTLLDHWGTRMERALTRKRYEQQKGYAISYYTSTDIERLVSLSGLRVVASRRFALGLPFGDRIWAYANFRLEHWFQRWSSRHGAEALYLLERV